nr:hypothetical protein [uncultured Flavobacterium sp.]
MRTINTNWNTDESQLFLEKIDSVFLIAVDKETDSGSLAPIASPVRYRSGVVEILCGLGFSPQRLQRIAGPLFLKKPILSAPKNQLEARFL